MFFTVNIGDEMKKQEKIFITIEKAMELYGFARKTYQNKVSQGILERYGTRGKILLDKQEVEAKMVYGVRKVA